MQSTSNVESSDTPPVPPVDGEQVSTPGGGDPTGSGLTPLSIRSEALAKFAQREVRLVSIQAWSAGTGVPIARIRQELAKHPDDLTEKTAAGTLILLPAAWPVLWQALGLDEFIALPGALEASKTEAAPSVPLTVHALPVNRRILEAIDENGRRVRVRVKDNTKWKRRDRIEARLTSPETPDLYEITSRPPRRWGDPL